MISSRQQYPEHVIVVEGNMLYYDRRVLELCAAKYMISIDRETCLTRRLTRDDWLRDNATYFDLCVWPGYEQYLAHIAPLEDITLLDGAQSIEQLTDIILRRVSVTAGGQHEIWKELLITNINSSPGSTVRGSNIKWLRQIAPFSILVIQIKN